MSTKFDGTGPFRWRVPRWAVLLALAAVGPPATASCWRDSGVTALAKSIAPNFPAAARRLPDVVVCEDRDFPPGIGGTFSAYENGATVIRVPVWQTGPQGGLDATLAHELAHAEAHQQGLSNEPFGGHGVGFFAALLKAGWQQEAERVAKIIVGADRALAAAREVLDGQRLADAGEGSDDGGSIRLVCSKVPRLQSVTLPSGRVVTRSVGELVCRTMSE